MPIYVKNRNLLAETEIRLIDTEITISSATRKEMSCLKKILPFTGVVVVYYVTIVESEHGLLKKYSDIFFAQKFVFLYYQIIILISFCSPCLYFQDRE